MNVDELIDNKLVHEIHTSERKSFRSCRRRWDWHFRESLYPLTTAKPLEFGVAYHIGMEVYYNPDTWDWDSEVREGLAIKAFVDSCEAQREKALEQNILFDADIEKDYNERVELGKGMMKYYFSKVAPKEDIGWKPVKVEIAFMLPIPNPETGEDIIWCKCKICQEKVLTYLGKQNEYIDYALSMVGDDIMISMNGQGHLPWPGLPVVYAGRLDMLAEDKHGNYWIFDWKTARAVSEDTEFLYLDDQVGSYPWALKKLGLNIQGFVYHEQRKGFPQPPHENKTRRLGCKFSVAKNQEVDYDTYVATVSKLDPEGWADGSYVDMLVYLQQEGPVFYARHQITKTWEELDEIETNIGLEALDMIDPNIRLYPSSSRFSCKQCAFRQPCMEKNAKGDYQYALDTMFEKKVHYYVREEETPSTESSRND